jgi:hypothetical protein
MGEEESRAGEKRKQGVGNKRRAGQGQALPVHFITVGSVRRCFHRAMWLLRG